MVTLNGFRRRKIPWNIFSCDVTNVSICFDAYSMKEEILVNDVEEVSSAKRRKSEDPTPRVLPLLYIQQGKLCQPTTQGNAQRIAAIINPVDTPVRS